MSLHINHKNPENKVYRIQISTDTMSNWRAYNKKCNLQSKLNRSLPRLSKSEPEMDVVSRRMQSFYLTLQQDMDEALVDGLKQQSPWITEFAAFRCEDSVIKFKYDVLVALKEAQPTQKDPYPLCRRHVNGEDSHFVQQTIDHFILCGLSQFIEINWDESVLASGNTPGVLRALIFSDISHEERSVLIGAMFEFKAVTAMYAWQLKTNGCPRDYNTCPITRRFFWRIVHCYAGMCIDFDKCASVADWGDAWFNEALSARKRDSAMDSVRAFVNLTAKSCDAYMRQYEEVLARHKALVADLRTAVIKGAKPSEICIIKDTLYKIQNFGNLKTLLRGVPMPPFDMSESLSVLERAEHLLTIMDFVNADAPGPQSVADDKAEEPVVTNEVVVVHETGIDRLIQSVFSHLPVDDVITNMLFSDVPPAVQLECVKYELQQIRSEAAECAMELRSIELGCIKKLVSSFKAVQHQIIHVAVSLQTIREDQHRRAVRREVKRVRVLLKTAVAQMLPFAVGQQKGAAVYELRLRATKEGSQIQALVLEVDRLKALILIYTTEEATLLAQHTKQQSIRLFLAAAPSFLPSAMFEPEVDCGLCLQTLDWNHDTSIGFVTCCREFGYLCGDCLARPHSDTHGVVAELEIARSVRGVRRALGI